MIKIVCPYCKNNIEVADNMTIYNLNRLGKSLHECNCCKKSILIFYDNGKIKAVRISK